MTLCIYDRMLLVLGQLFDHLTESYRALLFVHRVGRGYARCPLTLFEVRAGNYL